MRAPSDEVSHEVSFASDAVGWINGIISEAEGLPFSQAAIERRKGGSLKRRDITLYDAAGKPVLTGEIKLPYRPDGRSPFNFALVEDAVSKATQAGVDYFFTWNVNTFVLWKTLKKGVPLLNRDQEHHEVATIRTEEDLWDPDLPRRVIKFWRDFLPRYAKLLGGEEPILSKSLDERFIDVLDFALKTPAFLIRSAAWERYRADPSFRKRLNQWMSAQGMRIADEELTDNIAQIAKTAAYGLASRLMFYKALQKRFRPDLARLVIRKDVTTLRELQERLGRYFRNAEKVTGDYETVFSGTEVDELPFLTEDMVEAWRGFVEDIQPFDFETMDYDLLGPIFERMVSAKERHKWGQHYTKPEVCDIINAFVVQRPDDRVLDPACGGGTFLVRAYARKRYLAARDSVEVTHQELLSQINGVDISPYAAHISTVNLATRRLSDEENYPHVGAADFFDLSPHTPAFHVPTAPAAKRRGKRQPGSHLPNVPVSPVAAVIGNPPYIRQEKLEDDQKVLYGQKAALSKVPMKAVPGRADIHIYFWPHAADFLANGGMLGFLTSSNWLDTEYGFALQRWILSNFRIVAVLESSAEPWFTGARVATAVTILKRETDHEARCENPVRFVQFRAPLADLIGARAPDGAELSLVESFVQEIAGATGNLITPRYRLRALRQGDLLLQGLGTNKQPAPDVCDPIKRWPIESYRGAKWGLYLRAPDFYFELVDRFGERLVPLSEIAQVWRGVTTGADDFFCVRDITDEELAKGASIFQHRFRLKPEHTNKVRIIKAGDGSVHRVEAEYLVPEIHRLAEADSVELRAESLPRKLLLVDKPLDQLKGTHVAAYIRWGQQSPRRYHERSSCKGRQRWYDLSGHRPGQILWSMSHKYRHLVLWNADSVVCNHRLFGINASEDGADRVLCAVLNSTLVGWLKCYYGRPNGTEGYDTEVVDVKAMRVPDPRLVGDALAQRIESALEGIMGRKSSNLVQELNDVHREELDDAVFELLGVSSEAERKRLREKLYEETRRFYTSLRSVEVQATRNRTRTARRAKVTAHDVALDVWDRFDRALLRRFPRDFLPNEAIASEAIVLPQNAGKIDVGRALFTVDGVDGRGRSNGSLEAGLARAGGVTLDLGSMARAEYLALLVEAGESGTMMVPLDEAICRDAVSEFRSYLAELAKTVDEEVTAHVGEGKIRDQVATALMRICLRPHGDLSDQGSDLGRADAEPDWADNLEPEG